jgi:hypothetical protein
LKYLLNYKASSVRTFIGRACSELRMGDGVPVFVVISLELLEEALCSTFFSFTSTLNLTPNPL